MRLLIFCITLGLTPFLSPSLKSQTTIDSSRLIRVITYNILHGATVDGDFNLDEIAAAIGRYNPDLVALQEVDFKTNRAKGFDLATELGWRLKMTPLFGRAMPYDGGEYGEAILSKYSFLSTRNVALPHSPANEPRAALEITTQLPTGDTICFIGTHLDHLREEIDRVAQAKYLKEYFQINKHPTILAGDLNALPSSESIAILTEHWSLADQADSPAPTFPSSAPTIKIDYIMYAPSQRWKVHETKVLQDADASDHCGYLVVLELLK